MNDEKYFVNWINMKLKDLNLEIHSVRTDFADGFKIVALLEILSGKKAPRKLMEPKNEIFKLQNLTIVIDMAKTMVKNLMVNGRNFIGGTDIDAKLILGFIFDLVLHYQVNIIQIKNDQGKQVSGKDGLLMWCKRTTSGHESVSIDNFATSWQDGMAFLALVHSFNEASIDYQEEITQFQEQQQKSKEDQLQSNKVRLVKAFDLINKEMMVDKILDQDFAIQPSDKANITYLSMIYKAFYQNKKQINNNDVINRLIQKARKFEQTEQKLFKFIEDYKKCCDEVQQKITVEQEKIDKCDSVDQLNQMTENIYNNVKEDSTKLNKMMSDVENKLFVTQQAKQAISQSAVYQLPEEKSIDKLEQIQDDYQKSAQKSVDQIKQRIYKLNNRQIADIEEKIQEMIKQLIEKIKQFKSDLSLKIVDMDKIQDTDDFNELLTNVFNHDKQSQVETNSLFNDINSEIKQLNQAKLNLNIDKIEEFNLDEIVQLQDSLHEDHMKVVQDIKDCIKQLMKKQVQELINQLNEKFNCLNNNIDQYTNTNNNIKKNIDEIVINNATLEDKLKFEHQLQENERCVIKALEEQQNGFQKTVINLESIHNQINNINTQLGDPLHQSDILDKSNQVIVNYQQSVNNILKLIKETNFKISESILIDQIKQFNEIVKSALKELVIGGINKIEDPKILNNYLKQMYDNMNIQTQNMNQKLSEIESQQFSVQQNSHTYQIKEENKVQNLNKKIDVYQETCKDIIDQLKKQIEIVNKTILQKMQKEIDQLLQKFNETIKLFKDKLEKINVDNIKVIDELAKLQNTVFENDKESQQQLAQDVNIIQQKQLEYNQTCLQLQQTIGEQEKVQEITDELHQLHINKTNQIKNQIKEIQLLEMQQEEDKINELIKQFQEQMNQYNKDLLQYTKENQLQKLQHIPSMSKDQLQEVQQQLQQYQQQEIEAQNLLEKLKQTHENNINNFIQQQNLIDNQITHINNQKQQLQQKQFNQQELLFQLNNIVNEIKQNYQQLVKLLKQKQYQLIEFKLKQIVLEFNMLLKDLLKQQINSQIAKTFDLQQLEKLLNESQKRLQDNILLLNNKYKSIETDLQNCNQLKQYTKMDQTTQILQNDDSLPNLKQKIEIYKQQHETINKQIADQILIVKKQTLNKIEQQIVDMNVKFEQQIKDSENQINELSSQLQQLVDGNKDNTEQQLISFTSQVTDHDRQDNQLLNNTVNQIYNVSIEFNQQKQKYNMPISIFDQQRYSKQIDNIHQKYVQVQSKVKQAQIKAHENKCGILEQQMKQLIEELNVSVDEIVDKLNQEKQNISNNQDEQQNQEANLLQLIDQFINTDQEYTKQFIEKINDIEQIQQQINLIKLQMKQSLIGKEQIVQLQQNIQRIKKKIQDIVTVLREKIVELKIKNLSQKKDEQQQLFKQFCKSDPENQLITKDEAEQLLMACDQEVNERALDDLFKQNKKIKYEDFSKLADDKDNQIKDTDQKCIDAFQQISKDGKSISKDSLKEAKINDDDIQWVLSKMQKLDGNDEQYDFASFVKKLYE